jgi:hypothetical protein
MSPFAIDGVAVGPRAECKQVNVTSTSISLRTSVVTVLGTVKAPSHLPSLHCAQTPGKASRLCIEGVCAQPQSSN